MFSLRSKSKPARRASATTLTVAVCALLAIPALASAAPAEGEEPSLPQLAFEPGSYDFGLLEANRSNGQTNFQLRNVGSVSAPIYSINVVGSGSSAFWTGNSDCFGHPLEPSETCSVQVNFGPYAAVPFAAQLRAESDAGTSFTAELSGEGGRPALTAATNPTNFGSVPVESGGVTRTIDVTNEGNMPGGAFIAVISGGAVGSFHLLDENCTGFPLSPAATCNLPSQLRSDQHRRQDGPPLPGRRRRRRRADHADRHRARPRTDRRRVRTGRRGRRNRQAPPQAPSAPEEPSASWRLGWPRLQALAALGLASSADARGIRLQSPIGCAQPARGSRAGRARCESKRRPWRPTPSACPTVGSCPYPTRRPSWSRATARPASPSSSASTRSTSAPAGGRRSASAPATAATSRSRRG